MEGDLHPSPEPSPDDLSSPNPDHATPLLQAQQRPSSQAERDEMPPGSANGTGRMDSELAESAAVKEGVDTPDSLVVADRELSEQERTTGKESDGIEEEKDCEDKEAADRDTADEGLSLSRGSEDENEEDSLGQKEPPDANNNSLETPQDCQDDFIDIPESPAQVGLTHFSALKPKCESSSDREA